MKNALEDVLALILHGVLLLRGGRAYQLNNRPLNRVARRAARFRAARDYEARPQIATRGGGVAWHKQAV